MVSTVLFDLDGLLADTEPLHCRAYQQVLRRHGLDLSDEYYRDCWIRQGLGVTDFLRAQGSPLDPVPLRRQKSEEYARLVASCCVPMPGAMALLERLRGRKTLAVASSAYRDAVEAVLAKLAITERFAVIVTGNDVQRVKPQPDIFLQAARQLGVAARECVVIEDAEKGILAARSAGMKSIAVPNRYTADNDFSQADVVLTSLEEVTVAMIDGL